MNTRKLLSILDPIPLREILEAVKARQQSLLKRLDELDINMDNPDEVWGNKDLFDSLSNCRAIEYIISQELEKEEN